MSLIKDKVYRLVKPLQGTLTIHWLRLSYPYIYIISVCLSVCLSKHISENPGPICLKILIEELKRATESSKHGF